MFFCFKSLQSVVDISCLFVLSLCDGRGYEGCAKFLDIPECDVFSRLYALIICKQKAM